jgi:hypothetical protein
MSFLNNIPFLSSLTSSGNPNDRISLFYALMTMLPFGQLWARIFWLDGSLDKLWLLLPIPFFAPPFSIIPALAMYFGFIKKGQGGPTYDKFMLIPIIFKFILASLVPMFLTYINKTEYEYDEDDEYEDDYEDEQEKPSETKIFLYIFIFQIFIGMIPNLIRTYNICPNLTFRSFTKAFIDSTMSNGIGEIVPFVLQWIPFTGIILKGIRGILGLIELFTGIDIDTQFLNVLWCIFFSLGYIIINMLNGTNINKYCNIDLLGSDSGDMFGLVIVLIITLFVKVFNKFSLV